MLYAKHNFREDVVAFNPKSQQMMQAGYQDILVSDHYEKEDFIRFCEGGEFLPCTREEFNEVYVKQSQLINEFAKEL